MSTNVATATFVSAIWSVAFAWDTLPLYASAAVVPLVVILFGLVAYRLRDTVKPEIKVKLISMFWHYAWGCFASGLNGSAVALLSFVGISVGAGQNPQAIQSPNPAMLSYVFGTTLLLKSLEYFTRNPLPLELGNSAAPFSADAKLAVK